MLPKRPLALLLYALIGLITLAVAPFGARASSPQSPITVAVDVRDAARHILHSHLSIPVSPGPLLLRYPKWLPGTHAPSGPIENLANLKFSGGYKSISWRRDDVELYAFHLDVPKGVSHVEVDFDLLAVKQNGVPSTVALTTEQLAVVHWPFLLLYPDGPPASALTYAARIHMPAMWKWAGPLEAAGSDENGVSFKTVSLERLVDSPVLTGAHLRTIALDAEGEKSPLHEVDVVADSEAALDAPAWWVSSMKRLVTEAHALFGARPYRAYRFLYTLSDALPRPSGLEHHEASDNHAPEFSLVDETAQKRAAGLLPHEFVHSWNGKYRRPAGLVTPSFHQPMKDELLWIYEGLTSYLGDVLTARSGLRDEKMAHEALALTAAEMDARAGRAWRPLLDTAVSAPFLGDAPEAYSGARRGLDYYPESVLIWLAADVKIRALTDGKRSLDDFCRAFHGGAVDGTLPDVKSYTLDDVVAALNQIAPFDWRGFFKSRVDEIAPRAPLDGIEGAGYRLIYNETPNDLSRVAEDAGKTMNLRYTLGMTVREDGQIADVLPDLPGARAGLAPGMKIIAVDGRRFYPKLLRAAVKASKKGTAPISLIVETGDFVRLHSLDYHGCDRFPHLERIAEKPDLLEAIDAPRSPKR